MTSQKHRDEAELFYERSVNAREHHEVMRHLGRAQFHATLAVYEGMYELLGDGSLLSDSLTDLRSR
jgi:hypothetical protein